MRLGATLLAQVNVYPASEKVLLVPVTVAVTKQNQCVFCGHEVKFTLPARRGPLFIAVICNGGSQEAGGHRNPRHN